MCGPISPVASGRWWPGARSRNVSTVSAPSDAAVARHPHLGQLLAPGLVRVDCHSHTMWSGDATTTPDELLAAVTATGIDVLCITDHSATNGAVAMRDVLPCRVVVGEELRTTAGELIGLFLIERIPQGIRPDEFCHRVHEQGGVVYVPHPFDPMRQALRDDVMQQLAEAGLIDAVEVLNAKVSLPHLTQRAEDFAQLHDLPGGAGSDAHVPDAIGAAYMEMPDFSTPAEFLVSLRAGRAMGHHFDAARKWTARIVPSIT